MTIHYRVEIERCGVSGCHDDIQVKVLVTSSWETHVYGRYCRRHGYMVADEMNGRGPRRHLGERDSSTKVSHAASDEEPADVQ